MIAAVVAAHLQTVIQAESNIGLAFVFCSYKAMFDQPASALFAALLKQLAQMSSKVADMVWDIYDDYHGGRAPLDKIYGALRTACRTYKTVYFIIDGLDEYGHYDAVHARFIGPLLDIQTVADIRCLFTSR